MKQETGASSCVAGGGGMPHFPETVKALNTSKYPSSSQAIPSSRPSDDG